MSNRPDSNSRSGSDSRTRSELCPESDSGAESVPPGTDAAAHDPGACLLRDDALRIWNAAVAAVSAERLVRENVAVDGQWLVVADRRWRLADLDRIVVVGAGKAGAGMAAGLEQALGEQLASRHRLTGWLNVPADCVRPLRWIVLHPARPAGVNEPTAAGVEGAERILALVESLGPRDLCLCLLSGGGSALLPAPLAAISLQDKQEVTRRLSAAGANIRELNTVRKQLSRIKGGGLARHCRAGALATLVISDVLGDPLDIIASGPTVPDPSTPAEALAILDRLLGPDTPAPIRLALQTSQVRGVAERPEAVRQGHSTVDAIGEYVTASGCRVSHRVIGNNAVAVQAALAEAERLGYVAAGESSRILEGYADDIGRQLVYRVADMRRAARSEARSEARCGAASSPGALVTGGEPIVRLAPPAIRGRGGRNQQLVLAALDEFSQLDEFRQHAEQAGTKLPDEAVLFSRGLVILSGGTDGEDGPTDAAGAIADAGTLVDAGRLGLSLPDYLARNDAYHFFERTGGLIKTGPTHTNVCDVRVLLWR
jgi:hydroxypyruvate reductase